MEEEHLDFDALTPFDVRCVSSSDVLLILGDDNVLADSIINAVSHHLQPKTTFVNVFTTLDMDRQPYEEYIPNTCIFKNTDIDTLLRFLRKQKEMIQRCTDVDVDDDTRLAIRKTCNTFLILDRCPVKWFANDTVKHAFEFASQLQLTIVLRTLESISKLPSIVTAKSDFCFILSAAAGGEHGRLYNAVGGIAPQQRDFRRILQANTQSSRFCLVVDRRKRSYEFTRTRHPSLDDGMDPWMRAFARWHKKEAPANLRLGCPTLWRAERQHKNCTTEAPRRDVYTGNIPTLLDVLQNYGHCAEDERIQITIEIVKCDTSPDTTPLPDEVDEKDDDKRIKDWINEVRANDIDN